ncbi:methyltransferase type 12 [Pelistega indica]|uniref:Methyltransferase type 12 n=1 Tax=Pelistega indica TaxID=1414851 RepID=V8G722_9BURK|nr:MULTISPECIES: class I SAM-dependent methyltransferase [Pelistega]ETD72215.1 methyltransferase type 12 [Pelistega indica]
MPSNNEILQLLARWDRQQEGYIKQREERFNIMFDILGTTLGNNFTVIDAACGPGSLSCRLLERFPEAKVIAIDADVMLLEMAKVSLAPYADRAILIEADLSNEIWRDKVIEAANTLKVGKPSALVSTTALHWLSPGALAEFYGVVGELLMPGGIFMNGDHMRFDSRWPTLNSLSLSIRKQIEQEAVTNGEDDWDTWWMRASQITQLASLKERRDAFYTSKKTKRQTSGEDCSVDFHIAALRHAGFNEVGTIWQYLDNYVIFGRLPKINA